MRHDLIGTYELTTVHTSQGGEPYPITGELILTSAAAGVYVPSDRRYPQISVAWEGEVLKVGGPIGLDHSPDNYQVGWVVDSAFGGSWENLQTGLWRVYDSAGRELPNPGGYYCARRVEPDSLPEIPR